MLLVMNWLAEDINKTSRAKGWWMVQEDQDAPLRRRTFGETVALFGEEVAEVQREYREGRGLTEIYYTGKAMSGHSMESSKQNMRCEKPQGIPIEMADIIICVLDACAEYGIDIEDAIAIKVAYNRTRPEFKAGMSRRY